MLKIQYSSRQTWSLLSWSLQVIKQDCHLIIHKKIKIEQEVFKKRKGVVRGYIVWMWGAETALYLGCDELQEDSVHYKDLLKSSYNLAPQKSSPKTISPLQSSQWAFVSTYWSFLWRFNHCPWRPTLWNSLLISLLGAMIFIFIIIIFVIFFFIPNITMTTLPPPSFTVLGSFVCARHCDECLFNLFHIPLRKAVSLTSF